MRRLIDELAAVVVFAAVLALSSDALAAPNGAELQPGPQLYIVQFHSTDDVDDVADGLVAKHGVVIAHRYRHALRGAALVVPNEAALARLRQDPRIKTLELDQPVFAIGKSRPAPAPPAEQEPTGYRLIGAPVTPNEGAGVRVAIIDTGIELSHADLKGNIETTYARDCVNEPGGPFNDLAGHGTHVAGTVAAVDNSIGSIGVASGAKLVPVKVLNRRGSGSWASVICGVDHVTAHAAHIRVANMSLGGPGSECSSPTCTKSALQVAIENSVAAGVTYAVAAGNEAADASTSVPAAFSAVITVSAYSDADGALTSNDGWASFTNYGSVVDLAAPGVGIYSTMKGNGYGVMSGTSMAAPHVAAAAALYLSTHAGATPADVRNRLRALATTNYTGWTNPQHPEPLLDVRALLPCALACAPAGYNCGIIPDGCGGLLTCGTCSAPQSCGGAGVANVCGCTPTITCASAGVACGPLTDDCGQALDCGPCALP